MEPGRIGSGWQICEVHFNIMLTGGFNAMLFGDSGSFGQRSTFTWCLKHEVEGVLVRQDVANGWR
jgi:hypothetical protein